MVEVIQISTYPYGKRNNYPHMKPADVALWERFIDKFPEQFDNCQYDVPVGADPKFDTQAGVRPDDESWKLYQKKIDVVALRADSVIIIELKPRAGASSIGQILNYKRLYTKDYSPSEEPQALIITDYADDDTFALARDMNVAITIV